MKKAYYLSWAVALAFLLLALVAPLAEAKARGLRDRPPDRVYVVAPGEPASQDGAIDSDGRVPIYFVCGTRDLGSATPRETLSGEIEFIIRINPCALRRIGASVAEVRETIAHEKAHVRGFDHHESTPRRNEAYYP